jgi:hypothetical protein
MPSAPANSVSLPVTSSGTAASTTTPSTRSQLTMLNRELNRDIQAS